MSRLVLIGCETDARPYLSALRALHLQPVACIDPELARRRGRKPTAVVAARLTDLDLAFDAVIVTGPGAVGQGDLERLAAAGTPVLCDVATAAQLSPQGAWRMPPAVCTASPWRFAAWTLRLREALALPAFQGRLELLVRHGTPGGASGQPGVDVLVDPGSHWLDVIAWCVGGASPAALVDDACGGPAAEAMATLDCGGRVRARVELSRLRALGSVVRLVGAAATLEIDVVRDTAAERTRSCRALLEAWLATLSQRDPDPRLAEVGTAGLVAGLRAQRQAQRHVWETPRPPRRSPGVAGRSVLVTGASGFIGARLVEALADAGAQVTAVVRERSRAARIARCGVTLVEADLRQGAGELVAGQDLVFSLAYDFRRPGAANVAMHQGLADACARHGIDRFVHLSSIAVYDGWPGRDLDEASPRDAPGSEYKNAKRAIERDLVTRAAAGTLMSVILQPTIVYGPFGTLWTDRFLEPLAQGGALGLPDEALGECNGVYVDDVVEALLLAASVPVRPGAHYIVSGSGTFAWRALIEGYAAMFGIPVQAVPSGPPASRRSPVQRSVDFALRLAVRPRARALLAHVRDAIGDARVDRLRESLLGRSRAAGPAALYCPAHEQPVLFRARGVCSIARAEAALGYAPATPLEQALAIVAAYAAWRYRGTAFGGPTGA